MVTDLRPAIPNSNDDPLRAGMEVDMRRLTAAICFVLVAPSAYAQSDQAMTLAAVSDCIKDAIGTGSVEANGDVLILPCTGAKARILYGFLGNKIRTEVVQDRNGKFENRQFGNSACYRRVADQNGKAADDFRCDLIMPTGDALRE
jgi:hypothetical protein